MGVYLSVMCVVCVLRFTTTAVLQVGLGIRYSIYSFSGFVSPEFLVTVETESVYSVVYILPSCPVDQRVVNHLLCGRQRQGQVPTHTNHQTNYKV